MSKSRAMRSAFGAVFRQPAIYLAELIWRWVFNVAALLVCFYATIGYLDSLPVTDLDMLGLAGIVPGTAAAALRHIFDGSAPTFIRIAIVVAFGLGVLWWIAASVGRATTLAALLDLGRPPFRLVAAANALRLVLCFSSIVALLGAFLLASNRVQTKAHGGDPGTFYLFFLPLALGIALIWSIVSWYLTLAPVAARRTNDFWLASEAASELSRAHSAQFFWTGFATGVARSVFFVVAAISFLVVLSMAIQSPAVIAWLLLALYAAFCSAVSTFIHLLRLAAYVRIYEWDLELRQAGAAVAGVI